MRRQMLRILILGTGLLLASPLLADEIVYFMNGTAMPIRSHRIEKGMIHVELGSNSTLAFPASMIERIEQAGRPVYTGAATANQAVPNAAGSAPSMNGAAGVPARFRGASASARRRETMDPMDQLEAARSGSVPTPVSSSASPVGSKLKSMMNPTNAPVPPGLTRVGDHLGFPSRPGQPTAAGTAPTGFSLKGAAPPPPPDDADAVPPDSEEPPADADDPGEDEESPE